MTDSYLIVVGVDGSSAGQRALDWAVAEAARRERSDQPASVQVITAWWFDPNEVPQSVVDRAEDPRLTAQRVQTRAVAAARADHPEVSVAGEVVEGDPADVLGRASSGADLLVLGSHGHSQIFHAVLGSVAEACVRNATCPVLIIPVARSGSTSPGDITLTGTSP